MDTGDSPSIALCISTHFTNTHLASVGCQVPATSEPCALRAHLLAAVPSQVSEAEARADASLLSGNGAGCWATWRHGQCSYLRPDGPSLSSMPSFGSCCPRFKRGGGLHRPQGTAGRGCSASPRRCSPPEGLAGPCRLGRADAWHGPPREQRGTILQSEEHRGQWG